MNPQGGKTGKGPEQQGIKKSEAGTKGLDDGQSDDGRGNKSGSGRR